MKRKENDIRIQNNVHVLSENLTTPIYNQRKVYSFKITQMKSKIKWLEQLEFKKHKRFILCEINIREMHENALDMNVINEFL